MYISDGLFYFLGILSALIGYSRIKRARGGRRGSMFDVIFPVLGGLGTYHYFPMLYGAGGSLQLVGFTFAFLALSPLLGFFLFWKDGKLWKALLRLLLFVVVAVLGFLGYVAFFGEENVLYGLVSGLVLASLVSFPWKSRLRQWQSLRRIRKGRKRHDKEQRELQEQAEDEKYEAELRREEFMQNVIQELRE